MSEIQLGGGWTIEKVREEIVEQIWVDETGDMGGVHCMHCLGYEQGEIDRILILSTQTLRDERDRLRSTIRTLCSSGNRLLDDLIGRSDAAESFKYHVKQAQAALTPAGGGQREQHHPAFDEYGEHRQPTGLGDL